MKIRTKHKILANETASQILASGTFFCFSERLAAYTVEPGSLTHKLLALGAGVTALAFYGVNKCFLSSAVRKHESYHFDALLYNETEGFYRNVPKHIKLNELPLTDENAEELSKTADVRFQPLANEIDSDAKRAKHRAIFAAVGVGLLLVADAKLPGLDPVVRNMLLTIMTGTAVTEGYRAKYTNHSAKLLQRAAAIQRQ